MKNTILLVLLFLFILTILLFGNVVYETVFENFDNDENNDDTTTESVKMYVITLGHEDRIKNIKTQEAKINHNIIQVNAVKGDLLDTDQLIKDNILNREYYGNQEYTDKNIRKREIGCYMSHLNVYKQIKEEGDPNGFSIVFEDDFIVNSENFMEDINKIIQNTKTKNIEFDIIFLGQNSSTNNRGNFIIDNLYETNTNEHVLGTHALLINNKNIKKIIDHVKFIDIEFDVKISNLRKTNQLNVYVIYPFLVVQGDPSLPSNIRDLSIETFGPHSVYNYNE